MISVLVTALKRSFFWLAFVCAYLLASVATAQDIVCPSEDYSYGSQESENIADLLTCNIIEGDFRISGYTGSYLDFENLAVREIRGALVIQSLTAALRVQFSNLEYVANVQVLQNEQLRRVVFNDLERVGNVFVWQNNLLNELQFLGLHTPPHDIDIEYNPVLSRVRFTPLEVPPAAEEPVIAGTWIFSHNDLCRDYGTFGDEGVEDTYYVTLSADFSPLMVEVEEISIRHNQCAVLNFQGVTRADILRIGSADRRPEQPATEETRIGAVIYPNPGDPGVSVKYGFRDLKHVNYLEIANNPKLTETAFPALETAGKISVVWNPELRDFHFPKVERLENGLAISGNDSLVGGNYGAESQLKALRYVGGDFILFSNESLVSPRETLGINDLYIDRSDVTVDLNHNLTSLDGVRNIFNTLDSLTISGLALRSLDLFLDVTNITGRLDVSSLASVPDLSGLSNLRAISGGVVVEFLDIDYPDGMQHWKNIREGFTFRFNTINDCQALLPLFGWGTADYQIEGPIVLENNSPNNCNSAGGFPLLWKSQGVATGPLDFEPIRSELIPGGLRLTGLPTTADRLFPVTSYEGECTATNNRRFSLPFGAALDVYGFDVTTQPLTFENAGEVKSAKVGVDFVKIERDEISIAVKAPSQKFPATIWDRREAGSGKWNTVFPTNTAADAGSLESLVGLNANGEWNLYLTNTAEAGSLAGFNIEIESLYSASIDAGDVTDTVAVSLTGLPVAKSLDCKLTALNEYGIQIIGGAGFVGTRLAQVLEAKGENFQIFDKSLNGDLHCDVTDLTSVASLPPCRCPN